jgi:hypothetical protein
MAARFRGSGIKKFDDADVAGVTTDWRLDRRDVGDQPLFAVFAYSKRLFAQVRAVTVLPI